MDEQTLILYEKSEKEDQELIDKLLKLYQFDYDSLNLYMNKIKEHAPEVKGDLLALMDDFEKEYIENIMRQIPEISDKLFLDLLASIKNVDNRELSTEDYVKREYDRIMANWHKDNPKFDMPNGVITLSVNGETKFIKLGDNPSVNENSLYDIASMTKLYTEVILFRIIKEGKYGITCDTKLKDIKLSNGQAVKELYPNLDLDMTIRELISFNNVYRTEPNQQITEKTNREDALKALRTSYIGRDDYSYKIIPAMILTDLLEQITGKNYRESLKEVINNESDKSHNKYDRYIESILSDLPVGLDTKLKDIKLTGGKTVEELYSLLNPNMTIRELITLNNRYFTAGDKKVTDISDEDESINELRTAHIVEKEDNFLYTDLPIMILTDLLEQMTGKGYRELLSDYIIKPLELKNTVMDLSPEDERYTGLNKNGVNDPKSNIIGGGGHAGVITDAIDLIKFLSSIFEPGFIFDSEYDPMLFDMLGMNTTTSKNYSQIGIEISKIKEELKAEGKSEEEINKIIMELPRARETGVSTIGNLNVAAEGFKVNDYTYDGLAPQAIPYKGFMVQGSTKVQGDTAEFVIDGERYRTSSSMLTDIHNQYDNIKAANEKGNATKEYFVEGKGMMKMADARKSGLGYFGGYQDKLSNMLSIARIMEIYSQYRELHKRRAR